MKTLIEPHGGTLIQRRLTGTAREEALEHARSLRWLYPGDDALMDAEKIAVGAFSPLEGFMGQADLEEVLKSMHLASGVAWTLPILLLVDEETAADLREGETVVLAQRDDYPVALMEIQEKYRINPQKVAQGTFGTTDENHPGVAKLYAAGTWALAGPVMLLNLVDHPWRHLELLPIETRAEFQKRGWHRVVAFQTRNAPHRAHEYLQRVGLEVADGLLVHPILGSKKKGDYDNETILRAYHALIDNYFPKDRVFIAGLAIQMRYAGPREAVFHAIVRKNYGASMFMVGRDHAGVGNYYDPFAAQRIFEEFEDHEIGVEIIRFGNVFYCHACGSMASDKTCGHGPEHRVAISMTRVRDMLKRGETPPPEMVRPEVAEVLKAFYRAQE